MLRKSNLLLFCALLPACKFTTKENSSAKEVREVDCASYQGKEGEIRGVHNYPSITTLSAVFFYSYQKEQENLKKNMSPKDAQWFARVCKPEFKSAKNTGKNIYHESNRTENTGKFLDEIIKYNRISSIFNSFSNLILYHSKLAGLLDKTNDKKLVAVSKGFSEWSETLTIDSNITDSSLGLTGSSSSSETCGQFVRKYVLAGAIFGGMVAAIAPEALAIAVFGACVAAAPAAIVGIAVGALAGAILGKLAGHFLWDVSEQVKKITDDTSDFRLQGENPTSSIQKLKYGELLLRLELGKMIKGATPEDRRQLAVSLYEYWTILGKGMSQLPKDSSARFAYEEVVGLISADEASSGLALNYYIF